MAHRIAPKAESDLDDIWVHIARQSGSTEIANRLVDSISDRFALLADFPFLGRDRSADFGAGTRSFAVGEYIIVYVVEQGSVVILRVAHGRRDLEGLFGLNQIT